MITRKEYVKTTMGGHKKTHVIEYKLWFITLYKKETVLND